MSLVFPERLADESGYGYIQRGLAANGLSWGWLRSKTGIAAGILPSYEKAAAIMDLFHGRLFEHDFLSNQKRDDGRSYLRYYKHEFLGRWQVLGRHQKVCPKCLIQRGYQQRSAEFGPPAWSIHWRQFKFAYGYSIHVEHHKDG